MDGGAATTVFKARAPRSDSPGTVAGVNIESSFRSATAGCLHSSCWHAKAKSTTHQRGTPACGGNDRTSLSITGHTGMHSKAGIVLIYLGFQASNGAFEDYSVMGRTVGTRAFTTIW